LQPFSLPGERIDSQQWLPALGWLCGGCGGQAHVDTKEECGCGPRTDGPDQPAATG